MKSGTAPAITEVLNITEDSMPLEEPAVKAYQGVANIIAEEEVEEMEHRSSRTNRSNFVKTLPKPHSSIRP